MLGRKRALAVTPEAAVPVLERIGALYEGILRKHMRRHDGKYRDTAYFSIIDGEWPDVCRRLKERLHWGE